LLLLSRYIWWWIIIPGRIIRPVVSVSILTCLVYLICISVVLLGSSFLPTKVYCIVSAVWRTSLCIIRMFNKNDHHNTREHVSLVSMVWHISLIRRWFLLYQLKYSISANNVCLIHSLSRTCLLNIIVQCTTSEHIFRIDRTIVVIDVIEYNRHQYIIRMCITPIVIIEELSKNNMNFYSFWIHLPLQKGFSYQQRSIVLLPQYKEHHCV
jgi:hypothetical protein